MFGFRRSLTKVLLVDDDPFTLKVIESFLPKSQFRVITANNGNAGLLLARKELPNLILLDASMPVKDGWETLSQLKGDGKTSQIPVLMCTVVSDVASSDKAFHLRASGYITKPIQAEELIRKIHKSLGLPPPSASKVSAPAVADSIKDEFLNEAMEEGAGRLKEIRAMTERLDSDPSDFEAAENLQRAAHTLRGIFSQIGCAGIADLSKAVESLMGTHLKRRKAAPAHLVSCCKDAETALKSVMEGMRTKADIGGTTSRVIDRILECESHLS